MSVESISVNSKLRKKIESLCMYDNGSCSVRFNDLEDTFWFKDKYELQEFVNMQERERFFDKELRKGYFLYRNENNETFKYNVSCNRGVLTLINEEYIESVS